MKKDIQGLRKEIVERDDTIQDKVRLQANLLLIKFTKWNDDTLYYEIYICWNELTFGVFYTFQEKRIYDLKKKNQELEKFKFVLDYKIKELKKQIEPRENDIKQMKDQIQEVRLKNQIPGSLMTLYNTIRVLSWMYLKLVTWCVLNFSVVCVL